MLAEGHLKSRGSIQTGTSSAPTMQVMAPPHRSQLLGKRRNRGEKTTKTSSTAAPVQPSRIIILAGPPATFW